MGASFCVVFESEVPPHGTLGGDNLAVLNAHRKLDRLARANGLRSLNEFESYDPEDVADALDLDPDQVGGPPMQWFAAADGLAAVRALAAHLRAHPGDLSNSADVVAELAEMESELANAERAGVRFRFAVVP
jgi:hypothetical protein